MFLLDRDDELVNEVRIILREKKSAKKNAGHLSCIQFNKMSSVVER